MSGMDRQTGEPIGTMAHLRQSIQDILTTPLGTRVGRREYGSRLPNLVDLPISAGLKVDITTASADALGLWEPRFKLSRVHIASANASGKMELGFEGDYLGKPVTIDGVLV